MSSIFFTIFFWLFNASLLTILYFGVVLFLGIAIAVDAASGLVPLNFLLPFVGLVGIPTACVLAELLPKTRRSLPAFQLFYGVEAPLLTFCLLRFFWLRDLTSVNTVILLISVFGAIAFLHWMLHGDDAIAEPTANWLHLAGHTLMLMLALYLTAIMTFYVPPIVKSIVLYFLPLSLYALIAAPVTILLIGFASIPFGMAIAYGQAWRQSASSIASYSSKTAVGAFTAGVAGLGLGLVIFLQQQPQLQAFALLDSPAQTDAQRQELLQKSGLIRSGLLNAYLAAYRYPYIEDQSMQWMYESEFGLPLETAAVIQQAYDFVMSPFTYCGTRSDIEKAAGLYGQFFDTPILRGEPRSIKRAIQSTFDRNQAKAGLLDVDERRVWLADQQVKITPHDNWADVEIYETYQNQTIDQQEILYFFSLPESAVITGIWLGESSDRSRAFPYTIASRGAAQQVYNEEVQRGIDPALLEQVGPRQYRLRAFPIPPIGQGEMHLWFTYKVLQQDGKWPLPQLAERRNIYWTRQTQRQINGKTARSKDWLPAAIAAPNTVAPNTVAPNTPAIDRQIDLSWGGHVLATPFRDYRLPQGKRFAIVLDGSYSMNAHRKEVDRTFDELQNLLQQNQADLYLTATSPATPQRIDNLEWNPDKATFYGTLQPRQMLQQFQQLRGDADYDAIVLISDSGSYELTADSSTVLEMPDPLWVVHLGGLQPAYDDATLQAIQDSGGNVATNLQEVMQRIGTQPSRGAGTSFLNLVDGYAWYLTQASGSASIVKEFEAIAARQWVTHLSRYVKPNQVNQLDTIHAITQEYGIVSPYSSMVVLVNDAQRQRLNQLEQQDDRFNREVEDQQLPQPSSGMEVPGVPEPAEWLLLAIAAIGLGWIYRHQRGDRWNSGAIDRANSERTKD